METRMIKDRCAVGPYSKAVIAGDLIFTSGQLPINPETGMMPEGIEAQSRQSLANVRSALVGAGSDLSHVVKSTVFLKSMEDFPAMNKVYAEAFKDNAVLPARSTIQVARLPKDAMVEIEVVAIK